MSRWLALGEPVTVRLPQVKSKDERLRERAEAHALLNIGPRKQRPASLGAHFYEKYHGGENRDEQRFSSRLELRTLTLLAERNAVLKRMSGIPRRHVRLRRRVLAQILETHYIAKWW